MSPAREIKWVAARVKRADDHTPEELRAAIVKLTIDNLQLRQKIAEMTEERQELLTRIDEHEHPVKAADV